MKKQIYKTSIYMDTDINSIKVEDISRDMPMYNFIGKTIEKLLVKGPIMEIRFTDGSYGQVYANFPFHEVSRTKYNEYVETGHFGISGYCSDDSIFVNDPGAANGMRHD